MLRAATRPIQPAEVLPRFIRQHAGSEAAAGADAGEVGAEAAAFSNAPDLVAGRAAVIDEDFAAPTSSGRAAFLGLALRLGSQRSKAAGSEDHHLESHMGWRSPRTRRTGRESGRASVRGDGKGVHSPRNHVHLARNRGTQNEWMTSAEASLSVTGRPLGRTGCVGVAKGVPRGRRLCPTRTGARSPRRRWPWVRARVLATSTARRPRLEDEDRYQRQNDATDQITLPGGSLPSPGDPDERHHSGEDDAKTATIATVKGGVEDLEGPLPRGARSIASRRCRGPLSISRPAACRDRPP